MIVTNLRFHLYPRTTYTLKMNILKKSIKQKGGTIENIDLFQIVDQPNRWMYLEDRSTSNVNLPKR